MKTGDRVRAEAAAIIRDAIQRADALLRIAEEADAGGLPRDEWINVAVAERITGLPRSTIYRLARDGAGERTPTGGWRINRYWLLEMVLTKSQMAAAGINGAALGINSLGAILPQEIQRD
jgi:hypothetical protein